MKKRLPFQVYTFPMMIPGGSGLSFRHAKAVYPMSLAALVQPHLDHPDIDRWVDSLPTTRGG